MNTFPTTTERDSSLRSARLVLIVTFAVSTLSLVYMETELDSFFKKQHMGLLSLFFFLGVLLSVGSLGGYVGCLLGGRKRIAAGAGVAIGLSTLFWVLSMAGFLLIYWLRQWVS